MFRVPKGMQHVPKIPVIDMFMSFARGEPFNQQFERLVQPVLREMGMVRIWMRGHWDLVITDAKLAQEVLANHNKFPKSPLGGDKQLSQTLVRKLFGESNVINSDGEVWRRHRKVVNVAFRKQWEPSLFGDCVLDLFSNIDGFGAKPIDIYNQLQRFTLDALGKGIFSHSFNALNDGKENYYFNIYNQLYKMIFDPVYFMLPFLERWVPSRQKGHRMKDEFRAFLKQVIASRKKEILDGFQANDLLSLMIKETLSQDSCLSDEEVLNDTFVFFLAGHDTTANTLTSTIYYLSKHHDIQEHARQEVLAIVGDNQVVCPTLEMIKSMEYINCIIKESMRIITTVSQLRRFCQEEFHVGDGTVVPAGSSVVIHNWTIHHNPEVYPEPDVFNPDRFMDPHGVQAQNWMAFGSGSRKCIGINFAFTEQRVVLAMLLQKYTLTLGPHASAQSTPTLSSLGLTRPMNIDVVFTPRLNICGSTLQ
ncbi:hypothetical protein DSO57_1003376 [Entomophthora muscae]|uniref:Uncharacterized protein n=1 Tax=Entomophthora muscae TaxID=34485 RepID=A0ACC2SXE8_9FUNG|nr:hypothetical protein DSO57_1003376 [Entomophthora muscae]